MWRLAFGNRCKEPAFVHRQARSDAFEMCSSPPSNAVDRSASLPISQRGPHGCFSVQSRRHAALGFSGLIEAALSLRHEAYETELTGFREHDRTSAASAHLREPANPLGDA